MSEKSGTIRRAIAPIKKRLQDNIKAATALINTKLATKDAEGIEQLVDDIEAYTAKLNTSVNSLSERDKQWTDILIDLNDEDIAVEEKLYEQHASADTGYLAALEEGKKVISLLECKLKQIERSQQQKSVPKVDLNTSSVPSDSSRGAKTAKLPKLALPTFSGEPVDWQHFWPVFESNVDNTMLTGVEKFSYLRSCLKGAALDSIGGLPITDAAYVVAVDILKERFQRTPEQMVGHLYSQLKRLPSATMQTKDLQRTYDSCEKIIRQLKAANEDIEKNRSLVLDVCYKYPDQVLTELTHRKEISNQSTLAELQASLKDYITQSDSLSEMLQDLQPFNRQTSKSSSRPSQPSQISNGSSSAQSASCDKNSWNASGYSTALAVSERPPEQGLSAPKSPCYFCNGDHFNSKCTKFHTADQRFERLGVLKRCQQCLDSSHSTNQCRTYPSRIKCFFCRSSGDHASALCPKQFGNDDTGTVQLAGNVKETPDSARNESTRKKYHKGNRNGKPREDVFDGDSDQTPCALGVEEQAFLATAETIIRNPVTGAERTVRVILDNGCPRTFVLGSVAKELDLQSKSARNLYISAFGCKRTASHASLQLQFEMQLRDGNSLMVEANSVDLIVNRSAQPGNLPLATQRLVDSMGYAMADNPQNEGPPEVLIGSDYFWQLIPCQRMTSDDGVLLISSGLGLILAGRCQATDDEFPSLLCLTERSSASKIETHLSAISTTTKAVHDYPDVDEFWSLERIGINDDPIENDDEVAQREFDRTIRFEDGRYQVCWPWKDTHQHLLPTNYGLALGRFRSLAKRLVDGDQTLLKEYNNTIQDQLRRARGIIEKVPFDELTAPKHVVHYLPHHPVVRVGHNTTKVRIVYDASSKCRKDQMSLNECLYRGPVILPDLCAILIRFRLYNVAIIADIEKAFLQLGLQQSQRDVTRFMWFKDADTISLVDLESNIAVYRFERVPFGVISSSFLLSGTVQHHLHEAGTETAEAISDDMYVDNLVSGIDEESEATKFYDETKQLFHDANMNLREWGSNSEILLQHIPEIDKCAKRTIKVLGVTWNSEQDYLQLQRSSILPQECSTKRGVLKAIASIYDPLGVFQPCTLKAKCFMRQLWTDGFKWDDKLSAELQNAWKSIVSDITPIFDIKIQRKIEKPSTEINLAVFSDASKDAYATAVYLRSRDPIAGRWITTLVYAKSRLSPKQAKPISLPRLELLGLTIGVRAAEFVRKSLRQSEEIPCFIFCDSVCVLSWIRTDKPLKRFVANRVKQIRNLTSAEYHYVQSKDNPADICTRGLTGQEIASSEFWWCGPKWLSDDKEHWSTNPPIDPFSDREFLNEVTEDAEAVLLVGEAQHGNAESNPFEIDFEQFSSLNRLIRVIAWCMKFAKKLLTPLWAINPDEKPLLKQTIDGVTAQSILTHVDLTLAKSILLKSVQKQCFGNVFSAIESKKHHQLVKQLSLFVDDNGFLRCQGRLNQADLPWETISPILVPKNHHITKLIIVEAHQKLFHSGISHTLSQLRRLYWIPQGRNQVRRITTKCFLCRKYKGPPFALPRMPPWPRERVARSRPFQFVGLDYLGPVNVKMTDGSTQKMWCCLFTCLTIRAVHLECVTDCTTQCFMECLSRFIARRGCPEQVISDNAPQFRLAKTILDKTWQKVMTDDGVQSYIANEGISWRFITELAPWQGGVYERLVGVVKSTFRAMVGRRFLRWDEFITLITETEAIVNSRPITYVHSDLDSGLALRPMDFIVANPTGTPLVDHTVRPEGGDAGKFLLGFWKSKQKRLDSLWEQWYNDYLLSLRERDNAVHKGPRSKVTVPPKVGEVVIVKSSDAPRGCWKLAKVTRLVPSNDGNVRSVELMLPNRMTLKRPIYHLVGLEIPSVSDSSHAPADDDATGLQTHADDDDNGFGGFTESEVEDSEQQHLIRFGTAHSDNDAFLSSCVNTAALNIEGSLSSEAMLLNYLN